MSYTPSKEWFLRKSNSVTLSNTTSLQKMFDATTNGAMILPRGIFLVDWFFAVENMSTASGNALVSLLGAGTASISSSLLHAIGIDGAADTAANQPGKYVLTSTATTGNLFTATANTNMMAQIKATMFVGTSGTIIPSIGLATGVATATVRDGSYCYVRQLTEWSPAILGNLS
jgi:hypothetical protein